MRHFLSSLIAITTVASASARPEREPFDEAIDRGLAYLADQQDGDDGSWSSKVASRDPAISALSVMAFLAAGHVPGEGPYGDVVANGVRFVRSAQRRGIFVHPSRSYTMYCHGICTLMLAEVAGMTRAETADDIRGEIELAVKVILDAQVTTRGSEYRGGWRYQTTSRDGDISVTGWQLMALRAARNLGCDVPAERIEMAVQFVARCRDSRTGGYKYLPIDQRTGGNQPTPARTGTALLSLELAGKDYHRSAESQKAGSFLLDNGLQTDRDFFFYGVYYTAQGMFQLGGNYWKSYRPQLHNLLLRELPQRRDGSWSHKNTLTLEHRSGTTYATAMGVLALAVEYRLLPIYQRGSDEDDD